MWPNTFKAHQLIQYCRDKSVVSTDKANQLLFQAEYEQGKNLSDVQTLLDVARDLGVDENDMEDLRTYLTMDHGKPQVISEIQQGRSAYGIRGVPFFVVRPDDSSQRPVVFSGAQSPETLVEVFQQVAGQQD